MFDHFIKSIAYQSKDYFKIILCSIIVLYCLLVVITSMQGPSDWHDDYWYMRDMEEFLQKGSMQSNQYYPAMLTFDYTDPAKVLHNLPLMYLTIPFIFVLKSYWGWIVSNILFNLMTLFLILKILQLHKGSKQSMLMISSMFLFWITTVHTAAHPISEAGVTFFVVLLFYHFLTQKKKYSSIIINAFLLTITVLNRPSYLFLLPFILLFYFDHDKKANDEIHLSKFKQISYPIIYLLDFLVFYMIGQKAFPQAGINLMSPLTLPAGGSMIHFYSFKALPFSWGMLWEKFLYAFKLQIMGRGASHLPILVSFNSLIIIFLYGLKKKSYPFKVALFILINLILYFLIIFLIQYQTRFLHTMIPFLLISFYFVWKTKATKFLLNYAILFIFVNASITIFNIRLNHQQAMETKAMISELQELKNMNLMEGNLLCISGPKPINWIFREQKIVMLDNRVKYTLEDFRFIFKKIPFQYMLCKDKRNYPQILSEYNPIKIYKLSYPLEDLILYRFDYKEKQE